MEELSNENLAKKLAHYALEMQHNIIIGCPTNHVCDHFEAGGEALIACPLSYFDLYEEIEKRDFVNRQCIRKNARTIVLSTLLLLNETGQKKSVIKKKKKKKY